MMLEVQVNFADDAMAYFGNLMMMMMMKLTLRSRRCKLINQPRSTLGALPLCGDRSNMHCIAAAGLDTTSTISDDFTHHFAAA
jgi:hypothetical protein